LDREEDMLLLSPHKFKDRLFYGWIVVAAFFIISPITVGTRLSFGVFFKSIESEFYINRAVTSSIFSVYMVLSGVFVILGGWALDRYGPRIVVLLMGLFTGLSLVLTGQITALWQLFITYSFLLAIGTSASFVVLMSTVSRWFDKKKGLALGIAGSGAGLGILVMAPFATYLISTFDWRTAFLIIGIITWFIVIPLSRLLKKDPSEIGALLDGLESNSRVKCEQKRDNKEEDFYPAYLSLLQAARTRSFWLILFILLLFSSCMYLIFTHLVPHVTDIGFSAEEAATVLSLTGVTYIAGRVLMGAISDRIGRKIAGIICALLQAGAMVLIIWASDLWMLYLFALVYGFANAGMGPIVAALASDTFGLGKLGVILGVLDAGFAVGAAIGPIAGGLIFDTSKSYIMAFLLSAVALLVMALLIGLVRQETNRNYEQSRTSASNDNQ